MPQYRLEHYFAPTRPPFIPSGLSFLDLPPYVRRLVYEYLDLRALYVDLNYANIKVYLNYYSPEIRSWFKVHTDGWCPLRKLDVDDDDIDEVWEFDKTLSDPRLHGLFIGNRGYSVQQSLLLTSKQVHKEVEAFLYAATPFRICLGQPFGFKRLRSMSDEAVSHLSSLTLRLDVPKTMVLSDGWEDRPEPPQYMDFSCRLGKSILKQWISILERLTRLITPGRLKLRIIFRAKTMDDARAIVQPVLRLPQLQDCAICAEVHSQSCWWEKQTSRDSEWYEPSPPKEIESEISRLVEHTVRNLTQITDREPAPFRYLDLPQELRFAILEYSDLVSPDALQWRPRQWLKPSPYSECGSEDREHTMVDEENCLCSGTVHNRVVSPVDEFPCSLCCENCGGEEDHSGICYCSPRGPMWSSSCNCLLPRHPLFSVSSKVRQDAIPVYYACNQIVVTPFNSPKIKSLRSHNSGNWPVVAVHFTPRIELSLYLSSIARNALQHIRRLEWMFPCSKQAYLLPRTPAWYDYLDTLLMMENAMNLSALTFTINMAASGREDNNYSYFDMPLNEKAWRWWETVILPVRRLGDAGLKDFFVHLRCYDIENGRRAHHEQDLERAVMGRDYDSAKRGKPEERMQKLFRKIREMEAEDGY